MKRRHLWALAAASALLAGCSGGADATVTSTATSSATSTAISAATALPSSTQPTSTVPTVSSGSVGPSSAVGTPPAAASATSSAALGAPDPDVGATDPAPETTSTVIPAELDSQSAAWFSAVCEQMDVDMPAGDGDLPPQAVIDYVRRLSDAMIVTAGIATTLPPPTIDGGAALAGAVSTSMSTSGTDLGAKVDSYLVDMGGVNPYSMQSSVLSSQLSLSQAFEPLTSMDPAVNKALHQFPACQTYGF